MANRTPVAMVMMFAAIVITFLTVRVIIPALINMQNDGAIILALLLVPSLIVGWIYFLPFFKKFIKGEYI